MTLGESSLFNTTVKCRVDVFKMSQTNTTEEPHSVYTIEVTTPEKVKKSLKLL